MSSSQGGAGLLALNALTLTVDSAALLRVLIAYGLLRRGKVTWLVGLGMAGLDVLLSW
jgi:hypothetical protein